MILEEAINQLIRHTVDDIVGNTGYSIRAKEKDALRPNEVSYADVDVLIDTTLGWEEKVISETDVEGGIEVNYSSLREIMVSVNFYRANAMDNARRTHVGLVRQSTISRFTASKIGLIRRSEVRQISESLENSWEERAQIDIFLSSVSSDSEIISCIEAISISASHNAVQHQIEINKQ